MIRPGEEWGSPASAPPDLEVEGSDADLAAAVSAHPGLLVRFRPDGSSDLAGAVGLSVAGVGGAVAGRGVELGLDVLRIDDGPTALNTPVNMAVNMAVNVAVNMIVLGAPPDTLGRFARRFGANVRVDGKPLFHGPCTTIVVATGQFRRGLDVVPRGHPGDGRAEVQVYAVPARERRQLRVRLATGTHVPHPKITQRTGARVTISVDRRVACEIDGRPAPATDLVDVTVVPNAYRLLV